MELFADGTSLGKDNENWMTATDYVIPGNTKVIAVAAKSLHHHSGILGSFSNGLVTIVTDASWKCSNCFHPGWNSRDFDDRNWPAAVEVEKHGDSFLGNIAGIDSSAKWIWTSQRRLTYRYCRLNLR